MLAMDVGGFSFLLRKSLPFTVLWISYRHFLCISHNFPINVLCISHEFPTHFLHISYEFPLKFQWFSHKFPIHFPYMSYVFPIKIAYIPYDFPIHFLCFSHKFPIHFLWFSHTFPMIFPVSPWLPQPPEGELHFLGGSQLLSLLLSLGASCGIAWAGPISRLGWLGGYIYSIHGEYIPTNITGGVPPCGDLWVIYRWFNGS